MVSHGNLEAMYGCDVHPDGNGNGISHGCVCLWLQWLNHMGSHINRNAIASPMSICIGRLSETP
jgi:hypothetical protein